MVFQKSACIEPMYGELPFLERFQAAKDDGFAFVEFWSWTDKDLDAVKAAAERAGIGIAGFNGDAELSLVDPSQKEAYLDFLRRSVEAAKRVGARSLTIHSNGLGEGGAVINSYDGLSGTVKLCAMFDTLRECARIAEMTRLIGSPWLKVLYDVYHAQLNEGGLCGSIRAYGDQFGHIHMADAPGRHEPGTGEINCANVLKCLEENGYAGLIGFELIPKTTTAQAVRAIARL